MTDYVEQIARIIDMEFPWGGSMNRQVKRQISRDIARQIEKTLAPDLRKREPSEAMRREAEAQGIAPGGIAAKCWRVMHDAGGEKK